MSGGECEVLQSAADRDLHLPVQRIHHTEVAGQVRCQLDAIRTEPEQPRLRVVCARRQYRGPHEVNNVVTWRVPLVPRRVGVAGSRREHALVNRLPRRPADADRGDRTEPQ